jgi:hypothetical protein
MLKNLSFTQKIIWSIISLIPGGTFLAASEYIQRNDGGPRGVPWPVGLLFGMIFSGILMAITDLAGGSLLLGYLVSQAFGPAPLALEIWKDRRNGD